METSISFEKKMEPQRCPGPVAYLVVFCLNTISIVFEGKYLKKIDVSKIFAIFDSFLRKFRIFPNGISVGFDGNSVKIGIFRRNFREPKIKMVCAYSKIKYFEEILLDSYYSYFFPPDKPPNRGKRDNTVTIDAT